MKTLKDDLLIGAGPIAKFIGVSERKIFHMMQSGQLPGFKFGGRQWAFGGRVFSCQSLPKIVDVYED